MLLELKTCFNNGAIAKYLLLEHRYRKKNLMYLYCIMIKSNKLFIYNKNKQKLN